MTTCTRRGFGAAAAVSGLVLSTGVAHVQQKPRLVVIGGGIGGATVAKYLAMSIRAADVTLVEPKTRYTTCVFSNLYLAGMRSLESLTHGYENLAARYGIKVIHDKATDVDLVKQRVRLAGGTVLPYDRLIVSPGVAFAPGAIRGYDEAAYEKMPHAWSAGPQTTLLRAQLEAMDDGGVFLIVAPPDPYRCPQGPYERASLAAYYFKQFKPRSKVLILDAKDSFVDQNLFQDGWKKHYPGKIECLPARSIGGIERVDPKLRSVSTWNETFTANVTNVIPPQIAGGIAKTAGLVDSSGWCPIDPFTFESRVQRGVHVIGDAAHAGPMPKTAFCANAQAKACAFAIASDLMGTKPSAPHLFDAGFTFLAGNDVISDATAFVASSDTIRIASVSTSRVDEEKEQRRRAAQQAGGWYDAFTQDVFG